MGFSLRALLVGILTSAMLLNGAPWLEVCYCATDPSSESSPFQSCSSATPTDAVMASAPVRSAAAVPDSALEPDADDDVSTDSSASPDFPLLNAPRPTTLTFARPGAASSAAVRLALLQRLTI